MPENENNTPLDQYIENKLEYAKFLVNPSFEKTFPEINKDLALGFLDHFTYYKLSLKIEIINILLLYPTIAKNTINSYLRDIVAEIQLSRSKGGFERRQQNTNIQEAETKISETQNNKRNALFSKGGQN